MFIIPKWPMRVFFISGQTVNFRRDTPEKHFPHILYLIYGPPIKKFMLSYPYFLIFNTHQNRTHITTKTRGIFTYLGNMIESYQDIWDL
jgi:hypothetical protein